MSHMLIIQYYAGTTAGMVLSFTWYRKFKQIIF